MSPVDHRQQRYEQTYIILAAVFIASLVACNLIFRKFFVLTIPVPWGDGSYAFEQSVGILAYPVTFLVTDILSEIYGRRRANQVVTGGFFASAFVLLLLWVSNSTTNTPWSTPPNGWLDEKMFAHVFGQAWQPITASMAAYLTAQYLDIRFFHFWRRLTDGRHLWLRNNASTICSQVIDTGVVLALLATLPQEGDKGLTWEQFPSLFMNGVLFKVMFAAFDTPVFYLAVYWFRRWFPEQVDAVHRETATSGNPR
ncbi:MAG: hypothetical protein CMJ83_12670 [Planctomycetes bacterium]|nr:hypothetical protein [Planctomycetota bacterium]